MKKISEKLNPTAWSKTKTTMHIFALMMPLLSITASTASKSFHIESPNLGVFLRVRPAPHNSAAAAPSSSSLEPAAATYSQWSTWSNCSSKCAQRRRRACLTPLACGENVIIEKRACPDVRGPTGLVESCRPKSGDGIKRRHQTFLKRLLSDIYDPAREEESTLTMEEFLYSDWTVWSRCSRSCHQRRSKECQFPLLCGRKMILEERSCFPEGTRCSEMKRNNNTYNRTKIVYRGDEEEPEAAFGEKEEEEERQEEKEEERTEEAVKDGPKTTDGRSEKRRGEKKEKNETAIAFGDFECGMKPSFNPRRLRIIGGTLSRRGGWPWQVSVMNR